MSAATPERSVARLTLVVCCLAVFCSFFGITGCLVMLRGMQVDFGRTVPAMTWVPSSYTLAVAMFVILAGAAAERWGRRRLFVVGCLAQAAGAAVVATSHDLPQAVAGQVLAGLGAAAVMANSLTLVTLRFPDARERNQAIATWVGATGLGLSAGPVACGFLVDHASWRIPFALVAASMVLIAVAGTRVPETDRAARSIDLRGQVLTAATIGLLVVGLLRGGAVGFGDRQPLALLAGAAVAGVLLVLVELRVDQPILDVRLLGDRAYAASLLVGLAGLFGFVGSIMLQSQFGQRGLGLTPTETGLRLLLQVVPFAVVSYVSARIVATAGPRAVICGGLALAATGAGGLALLGPDRPLWQLALLLGAVGAGSACAVAPSTSAALSSVELQHLGQATIAVSAFRQVGAVLGTSLLGAVMLLHSFARLGEVLRAGGMPDVAARTAVEQTRSGSGTQVPDQLRGVLEPAFHTAFGSGAQLAYLVLASVLGLIAVAGALSLPRQLSPLLAPPPRPTTTADLVGSAR